MLRSVLPPWSPLHSLLATMCSAGAVGPGSPSYSLWLRSNWGDPTELLAAHTRGGRAWAAVVASGREVGPCIAALAGLLAASVPVDPPHVLKYVKCT